MQDSSESAVVNYIMVYYTASDDSSVVMLLMYGLIDRLLSCNHFDS